MRRPYKNQRGVNSVSSIAIDPECYPENWKILRLGNVCKTTSGGTPSRKNPDYYIGNIPWVKSGELPDGPVLEIEESVSEDAIKNSSAKVFPSGTLLIAMYGATVGKLGILNCDAATNQAVCAIFPPEVINSKYLFWYLRAVRSELISQAVGGAQPNISQGIIRDLSIPIAPLNEQTRIVAEIEKQFSRLDEAIANLKRVKANLKRYKAAVLKAAVEGKLTEEWRKQHPDVEPADKLLARILEERRANWRGRGKYKEPVAPDTSGLPELPEGWVWVTWEAVLAHEDGAFKRGPFGSALKKSFFVESGYKVYEQYCPINDDPSFARYFITEEKYFEMKGFSVRPYDFLISCSGVTLGRITQIPSEFEEGIINQALLRVRINPKTVEDSFFLELFRSPYFQEKIFDNAQGAAIPNVKGVKDLKAIPIPLPPLAEQRALVLKIDEIKTVIDDTGKQIEMNLKRADRLRHSILKQAFSGQLVPQNPSDEPASVLLERIRAKQHAAIKEPISHPRKSRTPAPETGAPSTEPHLMVAEASATYGEATIACILAAMQPGREYARAELVEPLGITTGQWHLAIQELKRQGRVRQVGERRASKYILQR